MDYNSGYSIQGIQELQQRVNQRRKDAVNNKNYQLQSVTTLQLDFIECIQDLTAYTIMLQNRNTLEVEGFLLNKIDTIIAMLENSKARIRMAKVEASFSMNSENV